MKRIKFNINEFVRVKLTAEGKAIHRRQWEDTQHYFPRLKAEYYPPLEDEEGWSKWQAWELMQTFGQHVSMSFKVPFETTIEILVNESA